MLDQLRDLSDFASFGLIFALVAGDAVFPAVPGETATFAGAVLSAQGDLSPLIVFGATLLGALLGDNVTFWIGRTGGRRLAPWLERRAGDHLVWARQELDDRGPVLIVTARFVPGGRNAVGLAAGALEVPWRTYMVWDACAAALWALFATGLGYVIGRTLSESFWLPLAVSCVIAVLVGAFGELLVRRRRRRRAG